MPTAREWKQALIKNPMVWIFVLMMLYFAIGGLELERKIPEFFERREHLKKLETDPDYANAHQFTNMVGDLHAKYPKDPADQARLLLDARRTGYKPIYIGNRDPRFYGTNAPKEALQRGTPPTMADLAYSIWVVDFSTNDEFLDMMLDRIERTGKFPDRTSLKSYTSVADKCSTQSSDAHYDYRVKKGEPGSFEHPLTQFDRSQPACQQFVQMMARR